MRTIDLGPPPIPPDLYYGDLKIAFMVPESSQVKQGQPVLGFDTQTLTQAVDAKRAELREVTAKIEQKVTDLRVRLISLEEQLAQAEAKLRKTLLDADVPPDVVARIEAQKTALDLKAQEQTVASIRAEIEAAHASGEAEKRLLQSQQTRAQGRVEALQAAVAAMTVVTPMDGIAIYKTTWNDQKKKIGDAVSSMEQVLSLPDLTEMKGVGDVDEADAGRVALAQRVTLRLETRPDDDLGGRIVKLARSVRRKSWRLPVNVYRVEIALDRTQPSFMRPAMRFRGAIEISRVPSVLAVPRTAVYLRDSGPVVWLKGHLGWSERRVSLGRSNRELVEVVAGLAEGDLVSPTDLAEKEGRPERRPGASG